MALKGKTINNRYRLYEKVRANEYLESFRAHDLDAGDEALFTVYSGHACSRKSEDVFRYKLDSRKVLGQTHPYFAAPRDAGTLYEHCFQVTSWYEGPTLAEILHAGRTFDYQQLIVFARDIASALAHIHNCGIKHLGLVQSYLHLSEYKKALLHNEQSHRIALAMGDSFFFGMSLVYFARNYREKGEFEKAKNYADEAIEYNRQKDLSQNLCAALIELGCIYLEANEHSKAIVCFEEAQKLDKAGYFSRQHVSHLYGHLAEAYCKAYSDVGDKNRQRDIQKALRASKAGLRKTRQWISLRPKALRSRALVLATQGNIAKAEQYLISAITQARKTGGRFDEARGLLEYALFLLQTGRSAQSRERLEQAYELFSAIGSNGYRELCGRLLGIKSDGKRPLDASIQQIRQQALQEAQISLATGMGDAAKLVLSLPTPGYDAGDHFVSIVSDLKSRGY